jgi:lipid-A-disaccharide synthase
MKIVVSAIEKSANLHLKKVLKYLKNPIAFSGICSFEIAPSLIDLEKNASMGFVDTIRKLPLFWELKKEMVFLAKDADKVLLIDSSGFNLPLAKAIKKEYKNKEIIYYILPQVWAWREKRAKTVEKYISKALSIIPFEKEYYSKSFSITYAGHPLLDEISDFKTDLTFSGKVAFLPGSRIGEIKRLMPLFRNIRKSIKKEAVLVVPPNLKDSLDIYGDIREFVVSYDTNKALFQSDFAFVCSGTATLQSALIGTPFVLVYKANPIDFFIAKRLVKLRYVGLANIFLTRANQSIMHPEFLQEKATEKNILKAFYEYDYESFFKGSLFLKKYLKYGSSKNVAQVLEQ